VGGSSGITAKWFISDYIAGEALLSFREGGLQVTGLAEFHQPVFLDFPGQLSFYYGAGAHIGFYRGHHHRRDYYDGLHRHGGGLALGPDAIVGIQYFFDVLPASISFDYKPYIDILRFRHFFRGFSDFSFSFRYQF